MFKPGLLISFVSLQKDIFQLILRQNIYIFKIFLIFTNALLDTMEYCEIWSCKLVITSANVIRPFFVKKKNTTSRNKKKLFFRSMEINA